MSAGNNRTDGGNPRLSVEQKQKMKKCAVFALMGVIFAGCMWFIFAPSADDRAKQEAQPGFNTDIPMPKEEGIIDNKKDAYEQEQVKRKQEERMRSLSDFSALLGDSAPEQPDGLALMTDEPAPKKSGSHAPQNRAQASIQTSAQAYRDMNRSLGSFYEKPKEDPEKEELKRQVEELQARMDETDNRKNSADSQLELMEKSFRMAARYMPGTAGAAGTETGAAAAGAAPADNGDVPGKTAVVPVSQVRERTVSALLPEMSDAEFIRMYGQPRNTGFLTATDGAGSGMKNTVSACIHAGQTVMDGQNVRLRLLEPMQAGSFTLPRNTVLSATARIQGDRLGITVHSLETGGTILPVGLTAYDLDGQSGIFIPDLQELGAAKEIVANMGTSAGTSINLSNDAGEQFAADMGRNLIQGVSQFTAKKLREVKVHLKAGYRILLLPDGSLKGSQAQPAKK
ncbi:MAG: conjugative transposon protein TraM [Bacteroidales bacterium]|jgi:conjugative transposon TraM protein|nr:conjugative transposon protein TraM [Bacteroidales bacterium]